MQKLQTFLTVFSIFIGSLEASLLDDARKFFDATLYETAIEKYLTLFKSSALAKQEQEEAQIRIAEGYLYEQNPTAALEILGKDPPNREGVYLQGVALKMLGDLSHAKETFEKVILTDPNRQQEGLFELGVIHFELEEEEEAIRGPLEQVKYFPGKEELFYQAQLYLARLDLRFDHCDKAVKRLRALQMSLPSGTLYSIQAAYWMGIAFYQKGNLHEAVQSFSAALPKRGFAMAPWHGNTLYYLVDCALKLAKTENTPAFYHQAEELLKGCEPSEETDLAMAELLILKGKHLGDDLATQRGFFLLNEPGKFTALPLRARVCALLAQVTVGEDREKALLELTEDSYKMTPQYGEGWFWRGEDMLKKGLSLKKTQPLDANQFFLNAALAFEKSRIAFKEKEKKFAATKLEAEALWHCKSKEHLRKGLALMEEVPPSGDALYLKGLIASQLDPKKGIEILKKSVKMPLDINDAEKIELLLGSLYYFDQNLNEAAQQFLSLAEKSQNKEMASRALLWAARCKEDQPEEAKSLRKKVYTLFPESSSAAEAYFLYYPYKDYVQGDRTSLKHLQGLKDKFPRSHLGIVAQYLIGVDFKRDRKTLEGKWIRKRDLNCSIEAFQEGETLFEELEKNQLIPEEEVSFYRKVKIRSTLERALANIAIADDSQGAKRQIFLEYAEEVFREIGDLLSSSHFVVQEGFPLLEESSYWLSQTLLKQGQKKEAQEELEKMVQKYKELNITRGYFLSRVWYELGLLALEDQKPQLALDYFSFAEDAAKGKILSTDQKIDLLIQKSLSYLALNETDKAMLLLSQAINSDEISSLRIKAMYLRADIYKQQGRKELARKQLEATSQKGGEWALKAKQKLDEDYGYP